MKQPRKEQHGQSDEPLPNHSEGGYLKLPHPVPGIRKCRKKTERIMSPLEIQRVQLVIQLQVTEREIMQLEAQRNRLVALYEEVFSFGCREESLDILSKIFSLEGEQTKLLHQFSAYEDLIAEIDQKMSEF